MRNATSESPNYAPAQTFSTFSSVCHKSNTQGARASSVHVEASKVDRSACADYVDKAILRAPRLNSNTQNLLKIVRADPSINTEHIALSELLARNAPHTDLYFPIARLLNAISHFLYRTFPDYAYTGQTAVFFPTSNDEIPGDFVEVATKPDIGAFMQTSVARQRAASNQSTINQGGIIVPWSRCISVIKVQTITASNVGQFKACLLNLRRYRADLNEVHGIHIDNNRLLLGSMSASGFWSSSDLKRVELNGYLAHAVLVYDSFLNRWPEIKLEPNFLEGTQFPIYSVSRVLMVPFYATAPPGRCTFAGFVLPDLTGSANVHPTQFIKISHQRLLEHSSSSHDLSRERRLYELAHSDGWLPGLARPINISSLPDNKSVNRSTNEEDRMMEIVHLGSLGEPLSQCRTVGALLAVIYDVITVLLALHNKSILHRDISVNNILCQPRHDGPATGHKQTAKSVRGLASILRSMQPGKHDDWAQELGVDLACLVTDLDHGACLDEDTVLTRRTGTTMTMAREVAGLPQADDWNCGLGKLKDRLKLHPELLSAAFGVEKEKGDVFMDSITAQFDRLEQIQERLEYHEINYPTADDAVRHRLRYDVESCWWVLLWHLIRAWPVSTDSGTTGPQANDYANFIHAMLTEQPARHIYTTNFNSLIHRDLRQVGRKLLVPMAQYLFACPWYHVEQEAIAPDGERLLVKDNHAALAMQRLILAFMVDPRNHQLIATRLQASPRPVNPSSGLYIAASISSGPSSQSAPSQSRSPRKRNRTDSPTPNARPAKRRETNRGAGSSALDGESWSTLSGSAIYECPSLGNRIGNLKRHSRWVAAGSTDGPV